VHRRGAQVRAFSTGSRSCIMTNSMSLIASAKWRCLSIQRLNGSFAGWGKDDLEPTFFQRVFHQVQDNYFVFNDQNTWTAFQGHAPP
jgi:hypothetical protein